MRRGNESMNGKTLKQYHWLREDMTAGSGEEPAWRVGEERTVEGKLSLRERGYHSSPTLWQALEYAPGPVACLVEVSEPAYHDNSKQVSRGRRLLCAANVERGLRLFASDCAERPLLREREAGREPDRRSWAVISVARRYADGQASDQELDAAHDAAHAAAEATAEAAYATYAATYAAYAAAYAAAKATAYAAYAAEREWQRWRFDELVTAGLHAEAERLGLALA